VKSQSPLPSSQPALVEYAADALPLSIDALYTAHPFYGSRKLTVLLEPTFGPINRKRVQRYMREMGIAGIAPGPHLSKRLTEQRIYPYLLRDLTAHHPNHIWGCEEVYLADYGTPREARHGIAGYFTFYNTARPHQARDYRRPADLYLG
jgi:hypothetical protein